MYTLVKFLSREPSENLVTALHFRLDKVIFFGYESHIEERRQDTGHFLKSYCDVKELEFIGVSRYALQECTDLIRSKIEEEKASGHRVFVDLTGAVGLVPVAFGMLEREMNLPMHIYDIPEDRLIELNRRDGVPSISETGGKRDIKLDLDRFIGMRCGVINYRMHKEIKGINNRQTDDRIVRLWKLFERYEAGWSSIAGILQKAKADKNLSVSIPVKAVRAVLGKDPRFTEEDFRRFVRDAGEEGLFLQTRTGGRYISFTYAAQMVRNCLIDAGSILELHVYRLLREESPNSKVGVHLDWDGVIHRQAGEDVVNEVDVIALKGLIPVFISCKIGKATKTALYELSAVSRRFGGKYVKMILVTAKGMNVTDLKRAKEMGIEVVGKDMKPYLF